MRKQLTVAVLALCMLGLVGGAVQAQLPGGINLPGVNRHTVRGMIGTLGSGWLTLLTANNTIIQIYIPGGYIPPAGLVAGKTVYATYSNNSSHQHILISMHGDNSANQPGNPNTSSSPVVNTLPQI